MIRQSVGESLNTFEIDRALPIANGPPDISVAGFIVKGNATKTFREALVLLPDYSQLVVMPQWKRAVSPKTVSSSYHCDGRFIRLR